jgi:hypothetical protein
MDNVQKNNFTDYNAPLSEPFRLYPLDTAFLRNKWQAY